MMKCDQKMHTLILTLPQMQHSSLESSPTPGALMLMLIFIAFKRSNKRSRGWRNRARRQPALCVTLVSMLATPGHRTPGRKNIEKQNFCTSCATKWFQCMHSNGDILCKAVPCSKVRQERVLIHEKGTHHERKFLITRRSANQG